MPDRGPYACTSASLEPSHVLQSMGVGDELAHSSIRFGFGRLTTPEEIDFAADQVITAVKKLRELSEEAIVALRPIDAGEVRLLRTTDLQCMACDVI